MNRRSTHLRPRASKYLVISSVNGALSISASGESAAAICLVFYGLQQIMNMLANSFRKLIFGGNQEEMLQVGRIANAVKEPHISCLAQTSDR